MRTQGSCPTRSAAKCRCRRIHRPTISVSRDAIRITAPPPAIGPALSDGKLDLIYANGALSIDGDVVLGTSPVRVSLRHRFDDVEPRDTLRVTALLDRQTAIELGLPDSEVFRGTAGIEGDYTRRADGAAELRADLDLTSARVEYASAGLLKPAGEKARAHIEASIDATRTPPEVRVTAWNADPAAPAALHGVFRVGIWEHDA